ncbi:DUF551 domain-containing protein [Enterobacter kobei]|uniref:DUF551 domain-containing protein n=1 Tax=Enterobacter kobei TaxID=208224 RepID=UPI003D6FDF73
MSTITKELAKLFRKITNSEIDAEGNAHVVLSPADSLLINNARIALASLEAEPAYFINRVKHSDAYGDDVELRTYCYELDALKSKEDFGGEIVPVYTAPPAPVSVPAAMEMDDDFDSAFEHGKAVGWNACRAAMLQGADGTLTNEGTIPVTQFKPVADLYGLTSPTGGETSFTFDAVEARDFIDGGWSCQEYVELERFQEAITNHTEDKLAMVDHSGDSNNMVEPVTTACELRDAVDAIRNSGIAIDGEKILAERDALNSPVIPDGWVACSEQMPEENAEQEVLACFKGGDISTLYYFEGRWDDAYGIVPIRQDVTHWMPLPAAPQQEAKNV